ncbi:hypothetical protein E8E13_006581 [Curvularia kusanoi]|uniref:Uncharacterized protein n=1 Tax=Curvularia kusanoi TaxID=90978 RepID=A0A9P4TET3_CURKU|nr:hypothetical protein E8E13_006581 [Curvularia kusanoi]
MAEATDCNDSVAVHVHQGSSQHTAAQITPPSESTNFPFMDLPGEIRNLIYIYALGCRTWKVHMGAGMDHPRTENATENALALLLVNRKIYKEARFFPYIHSTFQGRHTGHLREWLRCLSTEHRDLVASIKFDRRGYLVKNAENGVLRPSPTFWMDIPSVVGGNLNGLERIQVELSLLGWGWLDDREVNDAKEEAVKEMRELVEEKHPGVVVDVYLQGASPKS